jgi:hypothetical protein
MPRVKKILGKQSVRLEFYRVLAEIMKDLGVTSEILDEEVAHRALFNKIREHKLFSEIGFEECQQELLEIDHALWSARNRLREKHPAHTGYHVAKRKSLDEIEKIPDPKGVTKGRFGKWPED